MTYVSPSSCFALSLAGFQETSDKQRGAGMGEKQPMNELTRMYIALDRQRCGCPALVPKSRQFSLLMSTSSKFSVSPFLLPNQILNSFSHDTISNDWVSCVIKVFQVKGKGDFLRIEGSDRCA